MKKKKSKSAAKNKPAKPALKKVAAGKSRAAKPAVAHSVGKSGKRPSSWLDDEANKPVIDRYAKKLNSFLEAMADGKIEAHEVDAQEKRLVKLMRDVEPQLSPELHALVTQLLCELTAYDLMQTLFGLEQGRPKTQFVG